LNKVLELASVCEHPNAVWFTNLFGGRDVASREEVFLRENDPRGVCFIGVLGMTKRRVKKRLRDEESLDETGKEETGRATQTPKRVDWSVGETTALC
jgi:hypothetical protein